MATSGSFTTSSRPNTGYPRNATFSWSQASQSVANNQTTINWTFTLGGSSSSTSSIAIYSGSITVNGSTKSFNYAPSSSADYKKNGFVLASGSTTITHNADGTKTFSASGGVNIYGSSQYYSGSDNFTLNTIPRQANLTAAPNFNDEANPTITYENKAGNSVSSLQACIASTDGGTIYAAYRDISKTGTSYTFNLSSAERTALRNATPNSNSKTVRFYVKTVIGSNTFYSTKDVTLSITNANPTFSNFAYADTNSTITAITGNNQYIVQNKSTLRATITSGNKATANKGASMSSYTFAVSSYSGTASYSTSDINKDIGTINASSNQTLTITAKDSRGNTKAVSKTVSIVPYSTPGITASVTRLNNFEATTTISVSGSMSLLSVGGVTKNAVNSTNGIQYRYKETTTSTWGSWMDIASTTSSSGSVSTSPITSTFDNTKSYNFQFRITDKLETKTIDVLLQQGQPQFFVGTDGRVGVGGTPSLSKPSANLGQLEVKGRAVRNSAGMWVKSRENTVAYNDGGGGFAPSAASKSKNGVWAVGTYTTNDDMLYFNYTSDSDYNTSTNTYTGYTVETNGRTNLKPSYLNVRTTSRPTSANLSKEDTKYGNLSYMLATSSMTTGKIPGDGSILNMDWDNNGGYAVQLGITHDSPSRLFTRTQNGGTWSSWNEYEAVNSSAPFVSSLGTGGTSYTTTTSRNLIEKTITMTTKRRMMLYGFAVIATSANTSNIAISVDGTIIGTHSTTNVTGYFDGRSVMVMTDELSAGNHTIRLVLRAQNSSTTAKVATYSTCYLAGWPV